MDFVLSPVIFWIAKKLFFMPYGDYGNSYNAIDFNYLFFSPVYIALSFYQSFVKTIDTSIDSTSPVTILLLASLVYAIIGKREYEDNFKKDMKLSALGLITFSVGIFPYNVVGKFPSSADWSGRHEILLPLGASLFLFYGVKMLLKKIGVNSKTLTFVYVILIIVFVLQNIQNYSMYQKDWFKQISFMENIRHNPAIRSGTTFVIKDYTNDLNADNRILRFYEYSGFMKYVFGTETRLAIRESDYEKFPSDYESMLKFNILARYNLKDYKLTSPEYRIVIHHGPYKLTKNKLIELSVFSFFKPVLFKKKINCHKKVWVTA
jgi:hypothetical protein